MCFAWYKLCDLITSRFTRYVSSGVLLTCTQGLNWVPRRRRRQQQQQEEEEEEEEEAEEPRWKEQRSHQIQHGELKLKPISFEEFTHLWSTCWILVSKDRKVRFWARMGLQNLAWNGLVVISNPEKIWIRLRTTVYTKRSASKIQITVSDKTQISFYYF